MRYFLLFVVTLSSQLSIGQSFKVKEFKMILSDISASTHSREDDQGSSCGLVKVLTNVPNVEFRGNVVGDVENKSNEYWVYLKKGTTDFTILRPYYLPMIVKLSDYEINEISAKTTYQLVLKEVKLNPEKTGVNINVKPRNARLKIDNIPIEINMEGSYNFYLPKGDHVCQFSSDGYRSSTKMITTGKGVQRMDLELESMMADVNIVSQTEMAEIIVDKEVMGHGGWIGKMLPGKHHIEAKKEGYLPFSNTISLGEKEKRQITIPALQPITAKLNITSEPAGCKVYFDGQIIGRTPCVYPKALYGSHKLMIELDSCSFNERKTIDVSVKSEDSQDVNAIVMPTEKFEYYNKAWQNFHEGWECFFKHNGSESYVHDSVIEQLDNILNIIDFLDFSFLTKEITMTLFLGYADDDGLRKTSILKFMIEKYIDHDEYLSACTYDSKYKKGETLGKAIKLIEKYGFEWASYDKIELICRLYDLYDKDYRNASLFVNKWYKYYSQKLQKDESDYGMAYYVMKTWGDKCLEKSKKEDAIIWYKRSLTEYEKEAQEYERRDQDEDGLDWVSYYKRTIEELKDKIKKLQK